MGCAPSTIVVDSVVAVKIRISMMQINGMWAMY